MCCFTHVMKVVTTTLIRESLPDAMPNKSGPSQPAGLCARTTPVRSAIFTFSCVSSLALLLLLLLPSLTVLCSNTPHEPRLPRPLQTCAPESKQSALCSSEVVLLDSGSVQPSVFIFLRNGGKKICIPSEFVRE